jgi:glycosyltransferase involved in cell wall biosynthesis
MTSGKLFIHAINVHQGGGRALLTAILKSLPDGVTTVLSFDSRMRLPDAMRRDVEVKRVKPFVTHRFIAERWLIERVGPSDIVLCFGNLPPLFKLRGHVVVFVQNRYLIDKADLKEFPLKVWLRLTIERLWLSSRMSHVNEFVVQTPTMKRLLEIKTHGLVPTRVLPFVDAPSGYARILKHSRACREASFDFVYVASGEPHKNHQRLLEAWCLLAEEGLFPSLCLTLEAVPFARLCELIEEMRQRFGVRVSNAGGLSPNDALALYKKSVAAIYPSTFESFGLPLIEARQAGIPVLASELDYVRDVLDPEQTFAPESAQSIARAVKRFLGVAEGPLPLLDAKQFVASILNRT